MVSVGSTGHSGIGGQVPNVARRFRRSLGVTHPSKSLSVGTTMMHSSLTGSHIVPWPQGAVGKVMSGTYWFIYGFVIGSIALLSYFISGWFCDKCLDFCWRSRTTR